MAAIVAADRAFPAAVAELDRWADNMMRFLALTWMVALPWQISAETELEMRIHFEGEPVLSINGLTGTVCQVQWSDSPDDSTRWFHLHHAELMNGYASLSDAAWASNNVRFYRAARVPSTNMVLIPSGTFQMGDSLFEGASSELPVHEVFVSAFFMDRYEVTKEFWDVVFQWATNHGYDFDDSYPATGKASKHPVQGILWYDAMKWCNARSEKEGRTPAYWNPDTGEGPTVYRAGLGYPSVNRSAGYRLPTEAEWEKAARGGSSGERFPFGNTIDHNQANYFSMGFLYDLGPTLGHHPSFDDGTMPYTNPCGYFAPNNYGLYDMAGNVGEWCGDWYDSSYYESSSGVDPHGPSWGSYPVVRGGGWNDHASFARAANRAFAWQGDASINTGFRCVLSPTAHEE